MQCLGRTKTSNFRRRCSNNTKFLFCWQHLFQPLTGLVALIIFFGALSEFTGFSLRDFISSNSVNANPDLLCSMEYPIVKDSSNKYSRNKRNPDVIISNRGPTKAVSVACNLNIYIYDSIKDAITKYANQRFKNLDYAFFSHEIKPFEELRHSTIGIGGNNLLSIYVLEIVYHREPDMKAFNKKEYFFIENNKIISNNVFKKDKRYGKLMHMTENYTPRSKEGYIEVKFTGVDKKTWYIDADNALSARKSNDGRITILGLPIEQEKHLNKGYPYLKIKPSRFKETGYYIDAQVVNDYIEAKIVFEVINTGDSCAIITEDGFEAITYIEPHQVKYLTKTVTCRKHDNTTPSEDLLSAIETEETIFQLKSSVLYRVANDKDKLFKSTFSYKIGKNAVYTLE